MSSLNPKLIVVKGEDKTDQILNCQRHDNKYAITFQNGKVYPYNLENVEIDENPIVLDMDHTVIFRQGKPFYHVFQAQKFTRYTRVCFKQKNVLLTRLYQNTELEFIQSALIRPDVKDLFQYFTDIAAVVGLIGEDGQNILENRYKRIQFIREDSVLAAYFSGKSCRHERKGWKEIVYPFGFNISQKQAVEYALNNQVSVIEGPPGTGKTQTILNIIANIVMDGKSVAVVSGNNEATKNVQEKLTKNHVDFISAYLGSGKNKLEFIQSQSEKQIDLSEWSIGKEEYQKLQTDLNSRREELDRMLTCKNRLSQANQEYDAVLTEQKHFLEYYNQANPLDVSVVWHWKRNSYAILNLWIELEQYEIEQLSFWKRFRILVKYGIWSRDFCDALPEVRIAVCQKKFYEQKTAELERETGLLQQSLSKYNFDQKMDEYSQISMRLFRCKLQKKYGNILERKKYELQDLWKNSATFIHDYPVVLSTTYSLRSSLSSEFVYDYVIVDEASQVDLTTGVLALSCARNAVIVGDLKQLPNVITDETCRKTALISESHRVPVNYDYTQQSLLSSVIGVFQDVPRTMLREHYRCHPKIIGFCNQKFYQNQLILLKKEDSDRSPLAVYRTVPGNHSRNRTNMRQIDVIKNEVIPVQQLDVQKGSIGIVTPYRNQTECLHQEFCGTAVKSDTVDKFQGQERDVIILSTVDDEITDFADDPHRLNVAVSRAVDQLIVVTNGNESKRRTNIGDLIEYIQYNNCEVIQSKVFSIFDYLYQCYDEQRLAYLKKHRRISEFDSENLMFALITDILHEDFEQYDVTAHVPLRMIVRDWSSFTEEEIRYARNRNTHLDFLIFDRVTHGLILAIEVDGYHFHKNGTEQAERDVRKDHILETIGLKHIRFVTNQSGEKEKLIKQLKEIRV